MKTGTKVFLGFLGGATVGALGTFVACKKYYKHLLDDEIVPELYEDFDQRFEKMREDLDAKYQKEFNERVAEECMKAYKAGKGYDHGEEIKDEPSNEEKVKILKSAIDRKKGAKTGNKRVKTSNVDYTAYGGKMASRGEFGPSEGISEGETSENDTKAVNQDDLCLVADPKDHRFYSHTASHGKPYVIDMDDYCNQKPGYRKLTFEYYTEDGVFVDDDENPDLNIVMEIGSDLVKHWEEFSCDGDLYVRNENERADYEIIIVEKSYAEYMGAIRAQEDMADKM